MYKSTSRKKPPYNSRVTSLKGQKMGQFLARNGYINMVTEVTELPSLQQTPRFCKKSVLEKTKNHKMTNIANIRNIVKKIWCCTICRIVYRYCSRLSVHERKLYQKCRLITYYNYVTAGGGM